MIKLGDTKEDVLRLFSHFLKTEPENMEGRNFTYVVRGISWNVGIEFEDGTVAGYSGYNEGPDNYEELN